MQDLSWRTDGETSLYRQEIISFGGTKIFIIVSLGTLGFDILIVECIPLSGPLFVYEKLNAFIFIFYTNFHLKFPSR